MVSQPTMWCDMDHRSESQASIPMLQKLAMAAVKVMTVPSVRLVTLRKDMVRISLQDICCGCDRCLLTLVRCIVVSCLPLPYLGLPYLDFKLSPGTKERTIDLPCRSTAQYSR